MVGVVVWRGGAWYESVYVMWRGLWYVFVCSIACCDTGWCLVCGVFYLAWRVEVILVFGVCVCAFGVCCGVVYSVFLVWCGVMCLVSAVCGVWCMVGGVVCCRMSLFVVWCSGLWCGLWGVWMSLFFWCGVVCYAGLLYLV